MAYEFGPFRYDPVNRCLFREDREIALKPKTRELRVPGLAYGVNLLDGRVIEYIKSIASRPREP